MPLHMRIWPPFTIVWILFLCLLPSRTHASFDIEHFHIAPGTGKILTVELGQIGPHLELTPQFLFNYSYLPLRPPSENTNGAMVDHRISTDISLSLSLWQHFQIALLFPVAWYQTGEISSFQTLAPIGFGDLRLIAKGVFWENEASKQHEQNKVGFGIGLNADLSLPTGDPENYLGSGTVPPIFVIQATDKNKFVFRRIGRGFPSLQLKFVAHVRYRWFLLALNVGALFMPSEQYVVGVEMGHGITYGLGSQFTVWKKQDTTIYLSAELCGFSRSPFDVYSSPIEGMMAAQASFRSWNVLLGVGGGLGSGYGTPPVRVFAGFSYAFQLAPQRPLRIAPGPSMNPVVAPLAVLTSTQIELSQKTLLKFNDDQIQLSDYPILDQVIDILQSHPEITKLRIEGHTDNSGSPSYNLNLSKRRATSVKNYLVSKGVASERLSVEGFGNACPLVANDSEDHRAQNRRVEFIIAEQAGRPPNPAKCASDNKAYLE